MNMLDDVKASSSHIAVDYEGVVCPVILGKGTLKNFGAALNSVAETREIAFIADTRVAGLYGDLVLQSLKDNGFNTSSLYLSLENKDKVLRSVEGIYRFFTRIRADWGTTVVIMGGNVLIDTAGFAAATYCRGLRYALLPTTLLSQVDGAIGGCVGVHYRDYTNYVGARRQPLLIFSDLAVLDSLPLEELRAGFAEIVKQAVVADSRLWQQLLDRKDLNLHSHDFIGSLVDRTVRMKAELVKTGQDGCLNYGHTIAHALESVLKHRHIRHGEAVSIGMVGEMSLAEHLGFVAPGATSSLTDLLQRSGLPVQIGAHLVPKGMSATQMSKKIWDMCQYDKKMVGRTLRWVLPEKVAGYTRAPVARELAMKCIFDLMA